MHTHAVGEKDRIFGRILFPQMAPLAYETFVEQHAVADIGRIGNDEIFGDRCGIDCNEAIEKYNLCYVNYDAEDDVRTIEFDDFKVGDDVIIGLYDSEKENAFNKTAVAEQVQLATQRMN